MEQLEKQRRLELEEFKSLNEKKRFYEKLLEESNKEVTDTIANVLSKLTKESNDCAIDNIIGNNWMLQEQTPLKKKTAAQHEQPPLSLMAGMMESVPPPKKKYGAGYKRYTEDDIIAAMEEVRRGKAASQVSRSFNIPTRTLYYKVRKAKEKIASNSCRGFC